MRLGTLSVVMSAWLAMAGGALAQAEPDEIPEPPAPTRPLPQQAPRAALPANHLPPWQTLQGGYGNYYGGWNDYGYGGGCNSCGGCDSCGGCCKSCRPGLCCRLKMLKAKLCAAWECRKACRSCCKSSCCSSASSCCGSDMHGYEHHVMSPSDLPAPPPESTRYEDDGDETPREAPPQAAARPVMKRHYTVQRVTSARKSAKKKTKKYADD